MTRYLILCKSLTHAQRSARLLERAGITATVVKSESGLSTKGCRYAVQLARHFDEAVRILRDSDMLAGKLFFQREDGVYEEIMR